MVKGAARKPFTDRGSLKRQSCAASSIQKRRDEAKNEDGFCLHTRGRGKPWGTAGQTRGCGLRTLFRVFRPLASRGRRWGMQRCEVTCGTSGRHMNVRTNTDACVSSNLAYLFISESRPPETRCLGPAFLPPALLGAEMSTCAAVHAPPRECSRLSRQYLQTACCVPGLLRGCSSSFL